MDRYFSLTGPGLGAVAALATIGLIFVLRPLVIRAGLLDHPNDRKHHLNPIPLHGGIAMGIVFLLFIYSLPDMMSGRGSIASLVLGAAGFGLIGLFDDRLHIPASIRVSLEVVLLVCLAVALDLHLVHLGNLFGAGIAALGWTAIPLSVFAVFALTNGFNIIDGLDGLAGGIAAIAITSYLIAANLADHAGILPLLWVSLGCVVGYLALNAPFPGRKRAGVFMGDSGSLMLGFVLCWFSIRLSQGGSAILDPITAVWILGLPIIDTVHVTIDRVRRETGIFSPGRDHLHHRLLQAGLSSRNTVLLMWLVSAAFAAAGLLAQWLQVPNVVMFVVFVAIFAAYTRWIERLLPIEVKSSAVTSPGPVMPAQTEG